MAQNSVMNKAKTAKKHFTGNCHKGGKKGHMARDCWLNPKNKDNRLKWFDEKKFKCNNEVAAGGTDNASRKSDKL